MSNREGVAIFHGMDIIGALRDKFSQTRKGILFIMGLDLNLSFKTVRLPATL